MLKRSIQSYIACALAVQTKQKISVDRAITIFYEEVNSLFKPKMWVQFTTGYGLKYSSFNKKS